MTDAEFLRATAEFIRGSGLTNGPDRLESIAASLEANVLVPKVCVRKAADIAEEVGHHTLLTCLNRALAGEPPLNQPVHAAQEKQP